ncbi:MAG TPA: hypothetical protein RMH99_03760 [Sandaracinaceae bacterium LLY-WYZ-13_1]|nr:hypothetical protein [Sandaracinaceae bacterium LLY-WYZ-13_1]
MSRPLLLSFLLAAGCAGSEPAPSTGALAEPADEPGATRASREAAMTDEPADRAATAPRPAPPAEARPPLTVHPIDIDEAEDGRGAVVSGVDAIAFDLDARRFPPRAADPVLLLGPLRFTRYTHPRPGVLRFVADRAALRDGVEVAVQYGDDASTRVVVRDALELP